MTVITILGNHDQTESCSALPAFEIVLSSYSTDYYVRHLTGTTVVAC